MASSAAAKAKAMAAPSSPTSPSNSARIAALPRDCLFCDARDCDRANPRNRCSKCRLVYYCSAACANKDWEGDYDDDDGDLVTDEGGGVGGWNR